MKILHIAPNLGKGGAEDILVNLSSYLTLENDVTLFLFSRCVEDKYNISRLNKNVNIKSLFPYVFRFSSKVDKIRKILFYLLSPLLSFYIFFKLKMYKFDIVHINMTMASFYLPYFVFYINFCPNSKTKFVETFHTNTHLLKQFAKLVFKNSWSLVDHLIYEIGEFEDKNILKYSNVKSISFIPFGVPNAEKKDNSFCEEFYKKYNIDRNKFIFLTIARIRLHEKKFDKVLFSLKILKESGYRDFTYVVCGDGPDIELLRRLIKEYDLQNNVVLTGYVDNPQQIVYIANLFVVAMVGHDTGIAGLQAGMAGVPLVGIQTLENYDSTKDIIFSAFEPSALALQIKNLLDDKNLFMTYSENIYKYINTKYNIENFYISYKNLFEKLSNE